LDRSDWVQTRSGGNATKTIVGTVTDVLEAAVQIVPYCPRRQDEKRGFVNAEAPEVLRPADIS